MGTSTAAGLPEASGSRASAFQVGHRTLTACLIVSTSMIFRETLVLANEPPVGLAFKGDRSAFGTWRGGKGRWAGGGACAACR